MNGIGVFAFLCGIAFLVFALPVIFHRLTLGVMK